MLRNFDDLQKLGKDNIETTLKSFGLVSRSAQAIASEVADYSRKSFEDGTAAFDKLSGAKSLESAIQVQTDYLKSTYEGFVAEATKLSELYVDFATEACKPFAGAVAKAK